MHDIFISYANEDRSRAETLARALEEQNYTVWWDRKIPPGKYFENVINSAIEDARCVVVMWSKHSILSEWVKDEAQVAKDREILVPVIIDPISPPLGFRRIQAANLNDWPPKTNSDNFVIFLTAIKDLLSNGPDEIKDRKKYPTEPIKQEIKTQSDTKTQVTLSYIKVGIAVIALLIITTIIIFKFDFFRELWINDPFLGYYIIGAITMLSIIFMVLKFTNSDDNQLDYTKSICIAFGVLVIIALFWRGIQDLNYIFSSFDCKSPPEYWPPDLYAMPRSYLPYITIFIIFIPILVWIITEYTRSNRSQIFKYLLKLFFFLGLCRLAWEGLDQITRHYKPPCL